MERISLTAGLAALSMIDPEAAARVFALRAPLRPPRPDRLGAAFNSGPCGGAAGLPDGSRTRSAPPAARTATGGRERPGARHDGRYPPRHRVDHDASGGFDEARHGPAGSLVPAWVDELLGS